jgi:hypothetical protein
MGRFWTVMERGWCGGGRGVPRCEQIRGAVLCGAIVFRGAGTEELQWSQELVRLVLGRGRGSVQVKDQHETASSFPELSLPHNASIEAIPPHPRAHRAHFSDNKSQTYQSPCRR